MYDWYFAATCVHMLGQMGRVTSKGNEAKLKMKISYTQAEIRIKVVLIYCPMRYQLDDEGDKDNNYVFVVLLIHTLEQYKYIIINSSLFIQ